MFQPSPLPPLPLVRAEADDTLSALGQLGRCATAPKRTNATGGQNMAGKTWQIEGKYVEYCSCDLGYILSGEDQPKGTMFQIFSTIIETIMDPLFATIGFDWDLEKRRATVDIAGVVQARSEPIRNPVTDEEHRMIAVLPDGWVFHETENAAGFAKGMGAIKFDLNRRHSSLANVGWNQDGLLYTYDAYKQKFRRP